MNSQELPDSWNLCNTYMPIHRIIKVRSFGFGFTHFQGFQMPFGAPPIRSSPQNSEISEGFCFICPSVDHEVNATDALHCQQICVVLLASIAFFMFLLCFFVLQPVDTSDYFVDGGFVVPEHPALRDLWFSACMEGTAELSHDKAFFLHQTSPFNVFPEN